MTSMSYAIPDLSIVLPVYNEESHISGALDAVASYLTDGRVRAEVIVVDDGSTDGTGRLVEASRDRFVDLRLLRCDRHRGEGHALRLGMKIARGRHRLWIDAASALDIAVADELASGAADADLIIARPDLAVALSRRPWQRGVDAMRNRVARRLVGVVPATSGGLRWFRAEAADAIVARSRSSGRGLEAELLVLAPRLGFRARAQTAAVTGSGSHRKAPSVLDSVRVSRRARAIK